MNTFFSIDGPLYKFFTLVYNILVLNFLWIIFSLPIVTIGASTTALFYVWGKYVRKEGEYVFKDFLKSFEKNFKQATGIWIILLSVFVILAFNIRNLYFWGFYSKYLFVFYLCTLMEVIIISIYIFPILSRFDTTIINHFKNAFIMGIRYIPTTILIVIILAIVLILIYITGFYALISISSYALITSYMFQDIFNRYINNNTKEEIV